MKTWTVFSASRSPLTPSLTREAAVRSCSAIIWSRRRRGNGADSINNNNIPSQGLKSVLPIFSSFHHFLSTLFPNLAQPSLFFINTHHTASSEFREREKERPLFSLVFCLYEKKYIYYIRGQFEWFVTSVCVCVLKF